MNKIQSIRDSLDTNSKYSASPGNAPNFSAFEPLSTSDVMKIIFGMKTKSCEIDPILFGTRSQLTKCTTEVVDVNGKWDCR